METIKLSRTEIEAIDKQRFDWIGQFPKAIAFNECYIASIQLIDRVPKQFYSIELAVKNKSKWMNAFVDMHLENLIDLLNKSTNFRVEDFIEDGKLKQTHVNNAFWVREYLYTYIHCNGMNMNATQVIYEFDNNCNIYHIGAFSKFEFPAYFKQVKSHRRTSNSK